MACFMLNLGCMGFFHAIHGFSAARRPEKLPQGSFAVGRDGTLVASTLGLRWSSSALSQIGQSVLNALAQAREGDRPLTTVQTSQAGFRITARALKSGALVFLRPETEPASRLPKLPSFDMEHATVNDFALYLETYVECWKEFNHYLGLAREGGFTPEDEAQFLELKSLITQGLEVILAAVEQGAPRKDEVMALIVATPSLHYLAEHRQALFQIEGQWHKLFLTMQSLLGRLRLVQQKRQRQWGLRRIFGRRA